MKRHALIKYLPIMSVVWSLIISGCATTSEGGRYARANALHTVTTGSHIPQTVPMLGRQPASAQPLTVIDRQDMEMYGDQTISEVLARQSFIY